MFEPFQPVHLKSMYYPVWEMVYKIWIGRVSARGAMESLITRGLMSHLCSTYVHMVKDHIWYSERDS